MHSKDTSYRLLEIAKEPPESRRPHEILAVVALQDGDLVVAVEQLKRPAMLGSENAFAYLQLVRDRLAGGSNWFSLDDRLPAEATTELRGWQELAVPLDQLDLALDVELPLGFPERWNYWVASADLAAIVLAFE